MIGYIYILKNKCCEKVKIGSTRYPVNRYHSYTTYYPDKSEFIKLYQVNLGDLNCYQIDYELQKGDIFIHEYIEGGGTEFYQYPTEKQFKLFEEKYHYCKEVDIDSLELKNYPSDIEILKTELEDAEEKAKYRIEPENKNGFPNSFELDYINKEHTIQRDAFDKFKISFDLNKYFQGVYFLATGIGKTYIAFALCFYHLMVYPEHNILWITYRNDIINSQDFKILGDKVIKMNEGKFNVDTINNSKGKVIICLRQSIDNHYKKLNTNIINGILYDECHNASKISTSREELDKENEIIIKENGKTFKMLEHIKENNALCYRIGFSATPLTNNKEQCTGICKLYGTGNVINYLANCSLIEAVEKGLLLKPSIRYEAMDIDKFFKSYNEGIDEKSILVVNTIVTYINSILDDQKLIYKKGIIWFPTIALTEFFYSKMNKKDIDFLISHSKTKNDDEIIFKEARNNTLMFACSKFTTGFDCKNLEFCINMCINGAGHFNIQKLGRVTRNNKEEQDTAYMFQVIQKNTHQKLIESICDNVLGIGYSPDDIQRFFELKRTSIRNFSSSFQIELGDSFEMDNEMICNHVFMQLTEGTSETKSINLLRKINKSKEGDILENIHNNKYLDTDDKVREFFDSQLLHHHCIIDVTFNKCFDKDLQNRIKKVLYDENELTKKCEEYELSSENYQSTYIRGGDMKLPPWRYLTIAFNMYNKTYFEIFNEIPTFGDGF